MPLLTKIQAFCKLCCGNREALRSTYARLLRISHDRSKKLDPYCNNGNNLIRSAVTPIAVTSPPAPAPWMMSGLSPYRFV
jgi:hypothetical protein